MGKPSGRHGGGMVLFEATAGALKTAMEHPNSGHRRVSGINIQNLLPSHRRHRFGDRLSRR